MKTAAARMPGSSSSRMSRRPAAAVVATAARVTLAQVDVSGTWHVSSVGHERAAANEEQAERLVLVQSPDGAVRGHEFPGEADTFEVHGEVYENTLTLTQVSPWLRHLQ